MSTASSNGSTTRRRTSGSSRGASGSRATASRGSASPSTALAEIKHDVAALRTDALRLAHGLEEAAVQKVTRLTKRSKTEVENVHEQIKEYIGQRPIVSVLVAVGVGAVVAKLIRMR